MAAEAKKKKKAEAEKKGTRDDLLSASAATTSAQQPTIAASFMKAAQSGASTKKKTAANSNSMEDLDALLDADLLDDDDAEVATVTKKSPKKTKSAKASTAKATSAKSKVKKEEEDSPSLPSSSMDLSDSQTPLTQLPLTQVKVDEMEADDDELMAMEQAEMIANKKGSSSLPSSSLPPNLSGSVDASVMLDESVMMVVDDAEAHEYEGLDWTKISSTLGGPASSSSASDEKKKGAVNLDLTPLKDENGSLLFWWHDAYEDPFHRPGMVFMFGYVWDNAKKRFKSMMVQVEGIQRTLHLLPRPTATVADVRKEFAAIRSQWGVRDFLSKAVVKQYAFEEPGVERKAHEFLELLIPYAAGQTIPSKEDLHGDTFSHVFGATRTALETLVMEANLMGPSFLVLHSPSSYPAPTSWCEYECKIQDPSQIELAKFPSTSTGSGVTSNSANSANSNSSNSSNSNQTLPNSSNTSFNMPPTPKLKVLSLKVQVLYDHHTKSNEILAISGIERSGFDVEGATALDELHKSGGEVSFKPFTIFRRVGGVEPPVGLDHYLKQNPYIAMETSEKALLNRFMAKLGEFDPDVIAGHAITSFDLDVLLHRLHHFKINTWSKLGRLHRTNQPRITSNNSGGGQNSSSIFALREATAGRLLCDTYTAATEFLRSQKNYKLKTLARQHLDSKKVDISQNELLHLFSSSTENLHALAGHILNDAYLALQLVAKIDVLPLTKQLTELGGNLWSRSLTGARAERIEYLLMHKFHNSTTTYTAPSTDDHGTSSAPIKIGFIIPDKFKAAKSQNEKDGEGGKSSNAPSKNAPSYKGGLVLAPKSGLYEQFTLLLDFNSLYPSLIQEYNVCFTTIERSRDMVTGAWKQSEPPLASVPRGVLPSTIRELVDKRKEVKARLATEQDATKRKQLDMRQLAIKLVANSMYGCLGFRSSRFYAMPMAELITRKGREALEKAKSIAESVSMDVIYGDTDSIMISTHTNDYSKVREMGLELKKKINKSFNELEIDIDGIFKSLLLLQKKKYAALVCTGPQRPDGTVPVERQEKGLDLVRRDWAVIASETGKKILDCIFDQDGKRRQEGVEVVEGLQLILKQVGEAIKNGKRSPDEFAITKSMTKRPQDYPDAASQPHVQVALQLMKEGVPIAVGEAIQYVICITPELNGNSNNSKLNGNSNKKDDSIASRARPLEHVKRDNLKIDFVWYLTHQVHPTVSRLLEHIEGMDSSVIAECLGLDAEAFKKHKAASSSSNGGAPSFAHLASSSQQALSTRFQHCDKLRLTCRKCNSAFEYKGLIASQFSNPLSADGEDESLDPIKTGIISQEMLDSFFGGCACPHCATVVPEEQLKNALQLMIRRTQTKAYEAPWVCGECGRRTQLPVFRSGPRCASCFDLMRRDDSNPKNIYTQLLYLQRLVDETKAFEHWNIPADSLARDSLLRASPLSPDLASIVNNAISQNRFASIDCGALFAFFGGGGGSAASISFAPPSSSNTIQFEMDENNEEED